MFFGEGEKHILNLIARNFSSPLFPNTPRTVLTALLISWSSFFSNSKIQKMIFPNVGITSLLAEKITRVGGNDNKCVNFKIGSPNAKGAPKQERLSIYNLDLRL
jgi:hypothetical protein